MPYVPIWAGNPQDPGVAVLDIAERRWRVILEARAQLGPAIDLQRRLLTLVRDLAGAIERRGMPRLSLPPRYLAAKLSRGVPVFSSEPIPLPVPLMRKTLVDLCDALAEGGAGDSATHIRNAIDNGSMEPGSLLSASLSRNQAAIRTGAIHRGLAPDLVWLVAELAVSPFVHALQHTLFDNPGDAALRAALDDWNRGYCAACGSWPALAEVVGGHRTLRCSFCSSAWELNHYACIYCGESGEKFVTAAPDEERKDRRVEVCGACGGYLKTVDLVELSPFPLLSISDIESTDLDVAAMEHGYARPPLKDFAAR
jgi:formate dehydrogenase formation protein